MPIFQVICLQVTFGTIDLDGFWRLTYHRILFKMDTSNIPEFVLYISFCEFHDNHKFNVAEHLFGT